MLLLQNHLVIASGKMLLSLMSVQQSHLGCASRVHVPAYCGGHSVACQLACHTPAETLQGDPTWNEPELRTDHELHPNLSCNLNTLSLHPGSTGSGQPTVKLSRILWAGCWHMCYQGLNHINLCSNKWCGKTEVRNTQCFWMVLTHLTVIWAFKAASVSYIRVVEDAI